MTNKTRFSALQSINRSLDEVERSRNNANVSITTQASHATNRRSIDKDEAEMHLDTTMTSSINTDCDSSIVNEKRGANVTVSEENAEAGAQNLPTSKSSQKTKTPKFKLPYSGKSSPPVVELHDWIIRPLPDVKGVCVEGQKEGMSDFWHSSAIIDVKKRNFVKTATGTIYKLIGKLNKLCTLESGFSKYVACAFADGFPADWRKVLQKFYSNLEYSISIVDECSVVRGYSLKKRLETMHKKRSAVKHNPRGKVETVENLDSILTPVGLVKRCNSAENFTTTRSGRLSLPPLAQWQGQRYIISTNSNTLSVGFQTNNAEKALLEDTSSFMKLHKRLQKSLYHKSLSNSSLKSPSNTPVNSIGKKKTNSITKNSVSHTSFNRLNSNDESVTSDEGCSLPDDDLDCSKVLRNRTIMRYDTRNSASSKKEEHSKVLRNENRKRGQPKGKFYSHKDNLVQKRLVRQKKSSCGKGKQENQKKDSDIFMDSHAQYTPKSVSFTPLVDKEERKSRRTSASLNVSPFIKRNTKRVQERNKKRKYAESPVGDDTGYSTEEQSCLKLLDSTPKSCHKEQPRKRRKLSILTLKDNTLGDSWTVKEKDLFERALRSVDANSPNFWCEVSDIVSSKTEIECRQFHTSYLEQKTKKAPETKKLKRKSSGRQKGDPVRGGKGTMKRKEDMRDFLKEQDENYEDNPFEASPFVSRKLLVPMISNIDFDKDDSEIFGSNHNFFTPMTKNTKIGTPGTRLRAQLASTKKTPASQPTNHSINDTPITVVRQMADKYIHTFMNQQKRNSQCNSTNDPETEMDSTSPVDTGRLPSKSLFSPSIVVYDKERQVEEDEQEDNNPFIYYWNEDV